MMVDSSVTIEASTASKAAEELRQAKTEAEQKLAAAEQSRTELSQQFDEFKRSALTNQRDHLNLQSKIQILESEKAALRQQSSADQTRLAELSSQLAASRRQASEVYPTTPAYPDQRARVEHRHPRGRRRFDAQHDLFLCRHRRLRQRR